jgi:hypothetical protein
VYWHKTEEVHQNVTTSCHNVHKLSIRCHLWESAQDCGVKAYKMDKNVLCDKLFVLLRLEVLSGGKRIQRAISMLIIWEDFDTELL